MVRPTKYWTVRRNGDSLKLYEAGDYVGSISLNDLGALVKEQKYKRPTGVNAQ